jgi:hypothetical protein
LLFSIKTSFPGFIKYGGFKQSYLLPSRLNIKIDKFVGWKADPLAVDALTLTWDNFMFYAFSPFRFSLDGSRSIFKSIPNFSIL